MISSKECGLEITPQTAVFNNIINNNAKSVCVNSADENNNTNKNNNKNISN